MNLYKRLILQGQSKIENSLVKKRDIDFNYEYLKLNKIITFIGPRRAGKTFFMFYILQNLIAKQEIRLNQIVFIDFTALLLQDFNIENLLEAFFELNPELHPFIVFDEIQELDGFKNIVLYLYDKGYKVFLSGSNSKLLSSELSTQFRGRTLDIKVYPLSFNEFCFFKNEVIKNFYEIEQIGKLKNLFTDFLNYGAYPEIALISDENLKLDIIKNYFEVLFYKDLLERYGIENEFVLKYLIKKIIDSTTKEFNINKLFNEFKSLNIQVGKQTIYNYIEYLKEIFFIKEITDKYIKGSKKFYLYDVAYNNITFKENFGIRFENIIYNFIYRKYDNINYIKNKVGEIDFVINDTIYIQVCYELSDENINRELHLFELIDGEKILVYYQNNLSNNINEKDIKLLNIFEFFDFFLQ